MFYNTTNESDSQLIESLKKCRKQADRVRMIMTISGKLLTPYDVQRSYNRHFPHTEITSIRRTMTDLTSDGILEKRKDMIMEKYGKRNHRWRIKKLTLF